MPRGKLIVLEGPEGVGKTTQVARLSEHLRAVQVPHVTFREPGGTELGERIRNDLQVWTKVIKETGIKP